jgi:uncharacterized protein (DUF1697 family)
MPGAKTYIALLRGINVGGKNLLPMKDLVAMCEGAGCLKVRSYIQSGNVIFSASGDAARLPTLISAKIEKQFGHKPPIILRTTEQLEDVFRNNPFLKKGTPEEMLHVMFLASVPAAAAIASLDVHRSPPDTFIVRGQEIYLSLPNGAGRSRLTNAYFDSKLATVSTGRNWRTVAKLLELASG